MDRERGERVSMESQLRDRMRETAELQARYDAHSAELNARVNELTMGNEKLKIQVEEKDKTVQNLRRAVEHLEMKNGERNFADMQVSNVTEISL